MGSPRHHWNHGGRKECFVDTSYEMERWMKVALWQVLTNCLPCLFFGWSPGIPTRLWSGSSWALPTGLCGGGKVARVPRQHMWILRRTIPAKKDSSWLTEHKFIARVYQLLLTRGLSHTAFQGKSTDWAISLLSCVPAVRVNPYKGVPGIDFQPMGWSLPHPIRTAQL